MKRVICFIHASLFAVFSFAQEGLKSSFSADVFFSCARVSNSSLHQQQNFGYGGRISYHVRPLILSLGFNTFYWSYDFRYAKQVQMEKIEISWQSVSIPIEISCMLNAKSTGPNHIGLSAGISPLFANQYESTTYFTNGTSSMNREIKDYKPGTFIRFTAFYLCDITETLSIKITPGFDWISKSPFAGYELTQGSGPPSGIQLSEGNSFFLSAGILYNF